MEEEYDYSMYTTVCTISICPVSNKLKIHQANNRISEASLRHGPLKYLKIPLEFYYNKESGNIIYGDLMIYHYKQHPPHEKYVHVSNFVDDLYTLYQRSCKGALEEQHDKALRSAITTFFTRIYPLKLCSKKEASTIQYAFILPSPEYTNKTFIEEHFRPLLRATPWLTQDGPSSKIVFHSSIDTLGYLLNGSLLPWCKLRLQREKKYLFCNLEKVSGQDKLLLSANFIRAVYDPDLIAASGRSMTALDRKILLWPKLVAPSLTIEIPISPAIEGMNNLVKFLYMKLFAEGEDDLNHEELDDYNTDCGHNSLMHQLIYSISRSNSRGEWSRNITVDQFLGAREWRYILSVEYKKKLSQVTYMDILQFFNNFNISSIETKFMHYLNKYNDGESFQSLVTFSQLEPDKRIYQNRLHHKSINFSFANQHGNLFYLLKAQHSIFGFIKSLHRNNHATIMSVTERNFTKGYAYKALKMVQLSNRLGRPVVMKPMGETKQKSSKELAIQKEKLAMIDKIQPYKYYVEANISCTNETKISLNQVIETTAEDGTLQKSTISILDSSYQAPDMYDFIFDTVWNIIDGHLGSPQCKSLQDEELVDFDSYMAIRTDLINAIKNSMERKLDVIQNLDEVIYHYKTKPSCTCNILITHRLVMDIGLLPYLRCVAGEIVTSLKAKAIFGNYKISCLVLTGEFLYKLLEQGNSEYGELVWNQLQEAISSALNNKQLRIHLMMTKSVVLEDKNFNYKSFKLEKYRQVFSKQYYLKITTYGTENFQVYQDKGDNCVKVPITKQDNGLIWEIPLLAIEDKGDSKHSLTEKFSVVLDPEDSNIVYCVIELLALPLTDLGNVDTALNSEMNVVLFSDLHADDSSVEVLNARCTFPLVVKITPCSYLSAVDLRLRMGIDASAGDPLRYEHIAFSERLTLQKI